MFWLLLHLTATAVLAGIGWVVQVVVYPAFALVGDAQWPAYHRAHQRAVALVVLPPWLAQAVAAIGLTLDGLSPADIALGGLALAGVALTVFAAVPAHARLDRASSPPGTASSPSGTASSPSGTASSPSRAVGLRPLLRAHLARTLVWTASAGASLLIALPSVP